MELEYFRDLYEDAKLMYENRLDFSGSLILSLRFLQGKPSAEDISEKLYNSSQIVASKLAKKHPKYPEESIQRDFLLVLCAYCSGLWDRENVKKL